MKFIEESVILSSSSQKGQFTQESEENIRTSQIKIKKSKSSKQKSCHRWTISQNLLYIRYLKQNGERLSKKTKKKYCKFEKMSFFIESKSANQCRSHHQKMMMRYKTIEGIVQNLDPLNKSTNTQTKIQEISPKIQSIPQEIQIEVEQEKIVIFEAKLVDKSDSQEHSQSYTHMGIDDQEIFDVLA